ncbi:hypothetical protein GCM10023322_44770 [Rugosimonospora acidiphila]|uniref:Phospholipase C n=1 Tax=Rugosimonospora acidiphila TaxID=556531 RepID=A0ABP9S3E1_9ACTN
MAAGAVLPSAAQANGPGKPSKPCLYGDIRDVKHVVILMQENRSFDHYFGSLSGVRGFDDRSTITLPGGAPVFRQPTTIGGQSQYPWHLSDTPPEGSEDPETVAQTSAGLGHSWEDQHGAWYGGLMNGWMSRPTTTRRTVRTRTTCRRTAAPRTRWTRSSTAPAGTTCRSGWPATPPGRGATSGTWRTASTASPAELQPRAHRPSRHPANAVRGAGVKRTGAAGPRLSAAKWMMMFFGRAYSEWGSIPSGTVMGIGPRVLALLTPDATPA